MLCYTKLLGKNSKNNEAVREKNAPRPSPNFSSQISIQKKDHITVSHVQFAVHFECKIIMQVGTFIINHKKNT